MHTSRIIILVSILIFFSSCKFQSYKDYELSPYDGVLSWNQVVKNAEWTNRYDHEAAAFINKLWVFGGYNPGQVSGDTYYEDVWSSADGKKWSLVTKTAPWKGRRGHEVVVFNDGASDALYLIGGFSVDEETGFRQYCNDVWRSVDGLNWTQIKTRSYPDLDSDTDWFPRMHHSCVTANHGGIDYIYLIAGRTMLEDHNVRYASKYFNDVWRSTDGIVWEKIVSNDYGIRSEAAVVVDDNNNIYLNGGMHGVIFESENNSNHPIDNWEALWTSADSQVWTDHKDTDVVDGNFYFRSGHQMVFYNDLIWSLPGKTTSNEHYLFGGDSYYPIWTYDPDGSWNVDSRGTDIDARHSYEALVWNNKIWILGGFTATSGQSNDVWTGEL